MLGTELGVGRSVKFLRDFANGLVSHTPTLVDMELEPITNLISVASVGREFADRYSDKLAKSMPQLITKEA